MPYHGSVHGFIEAPLFSKLVYDYLTDDEYAAMQAHLSANPEAGKLVRGSGGVRKLRWSRAGSGKSAQGFEKGDGRCR